MSAGDDGRDQDGLRWLVPEGGGEAVGHYGPSSLGKVLDDGKALQRYRERSILTGLIQPVVEAPPGLRRVDQIDLMTVVRTCKGDRDVLNQVADDAYERSGADEKAKYGSLLHKKTEYLDAGARFKGSMNLDEDLSAYRQLTEGFRYEAIEPLVATEELGIFLAGRPDRLGQVITDTKTGRDIYAQQLSIAVQLACYAHCRYYHDDGTRTAYQARHDIGYVFWIREGWGKLVEVDLVRGWEYAQLAAEVLRARQAKGLLSSVRSTESARRNSIDKAIRAEILLRCHSDEDLKALWAKEKKHWNVELTNLVADRRNYLASQRG